MVGLLGLVGAELDGVAELVGEHHSHGRLAELGDELRQQFGVVVCHEIAVEAVEGVALHIDVERLRRAATGDRLDTIRIRGVDASRERRERAAVHGGELLLPECLDVAERGGQVAVVAVVDVVGAEVDDPFLDGDRRGVDRRVLSRVVGCRRWDLCCRADVGLVREDVAIVVLTRPRGLRRRAARPCSRPSPAGRSPPPMQSAHAYGLSLGTASAKSPSARSRCDQGLHLVDFTGLRRRSWRRRIVELRSRWRGRARTAPCGSPPWWWATIRSTNSLSASVPLLASSLSMSASDASPGMRSLGVGSFIHVIAVSLSFVSVAPYVTEQLDHAADVDALSEDDLAGDDAQLGIGVVQRQVVAAPRLTACSWWVRMSCRKPMSTAFGSGVARLLPITHPRAAHSTAMANGEHAQVELALPPRPDLDLVGLGDDLVDLIHTHQLRS